MWRFDAIPLIPYSVKILLIAFPQSDKKTIFFPVRERQAIVNKTLPMQWLSSSDPVGDKLLFECLDRRLS